MNVYKLLNNKNNRNFGLLFSAIFFLIFIYKLIDKNEFNLFLIIISIFSLILSLTKPNFFKYFNFLWLNFGNLLALTMSKAFLVFFFFLILTPISIMAKLIGKDFLKLKKTDEVKSFWEKRNSKIKSMKYQS